MKRMTTVMLTAITLASFAACSDPVPEGSGGTGGTAGAGGMRGTGGEASTGGRIGAGGRLGSGGMMGSGGNAGTGGRSGGGATGTSTQTGPCPYTVASFSCEAACENLHDIYVRCQDDPSLPTEVQAMLGLYGEATFLCAPSCAVVAPSSQAQWSCFQGIPDDASCSAIADCNATNCP